MEFLYKYAKKYWHQFSAAVFFVSLEAFCDLLQPTIMAKIIDQGVAERRMDLVLQLGLMMLGVTFIGAIAATVRNIISSKVSQRMGTELRLDLYQKIQGLSFANLDSLNRASLVTRLTNDVTQVQMLVNGLMRISLKAPLLCIGSLIMAFNLNSKLTVVLAIAVPIIMVLIGLNMKLGFPLFRKVQEALDALNGAAREYLAGVRVVKAYNRFTYEIDKFEKANDDLQSWSIAAMRRMAVFVPGIMLTMNLGIIAVLWQGGLGVKQGDVEVGQVIAFTNYMSQILVSLIIISMVFNVFIKAKVSAQRIGEVFSKENSQGWRQELSTYTAGRIDFENVGFAYEGQQPILKQISFTCLPGEMLGLVGSTGAGKSTLVNLLPRFYDATEGYVRVDGQDVAQLKPTSLRERIAIVPQKTVLFSGTIADNLRWGKKDATQSELEAAARAAQAHEFIRSFPEGYDTRLGQGGVNLSGGQKQRLAIARALIKQPDILILDDCTSAVDVATEAKIKYALKQYSRQLTCIIISQRISAVKDADQILVLDDGQLVGKGRHGELAVSCRVYREILQSQLGKEESV